MSFRRASGRLELQLSATRSGPDINVLIFGGAAHLGAVALASPGALNGVCALNGHYEAGLCAEMALQLADDLGCNVAVSAGIHYDAISKPEIAEVLELARQLCRDLAAGLKGGRDADAGRIERI